MENKAFIFKNIDNLTRLKQKITLLAIYILSSFTSIFAQESPYYQLPQNRKSESELVTMPNLKTFTITYFIAAKVGIKKPFLGENAISPSTIESSAQSEGFWDISIGQTRNDNWIFELGLAKYNSYLITRFLELGRNPLPFKNETKQFYIPLRVKKKLFTLDKVSRSAFLNIGFGASYLIKNQKKTSEQGRILFNQRPNPDPRDYTNLDFEISSSNFPFAFEFITEIRGKVSERLEITAFGKAFIRPNKFLSNQFTFNYVDQTSVNFGVFEKPYSILFGLQARLNSPKYYSYKSRVD